MVGLLITACLILLFSREDYFLPLLKNSTTSPSLCFQIWWFHWTCPEFLSSSWNRNTDDFWSWHGHLVSHSPRAQNRGIFGMILGLGRCCAPLEDIGWTVLPLTCARWNHPPLKSNQAAVFSPRSQLLFARAGSWRRDTHTWDFVPDWYRAASLWLLHQRRLGCRHGGRCRHVTRAPREALGTQHQVWTQLLLVEPGQLQPHPHRHRAREYRNR